MSAQLTANGSVPPRPGNAFELYKEKLKVIGEFMETDTSAAAVKAMWKSLPKHERDKLTREAKENKNAFDKMYPDWKKSTPKNKEVATRMEELRRTAKVPREISKLSLAAGMPVAQSVHIASSEPLAPRIAMTPLSQARQSDSRIIFPERRMAPVTPLSERHNHYQITRIHSSGVVASSGGHGKGTQPYDAFFQRPGSQGTKEQENQNHSKSRKPSKNLFSSVHFPSFVIP